MRLLVCFALSWALLPAMFGQKYAGPVPEKPDVPYIVQADNLIPTEAAVAKQQKGKKGDTLYIVDGAGSTARTPLASPIFIVKAKDLPVEKLQLYRLDVKNGHREITLHAGKNARNPQPIRVDLKRFDDDIVRIQVDESLANGEYSFSPEGSNDVFCFQVF